MRKASIFLRLLAFVIDVLVLSFFMFLLFIAIVGGYLLSTESFIHTQTFLLTFFFVCGSFLTFIFYFTYLTMDGSVTVGKHMFKLQVVRPNGSGLTAFTAFIRSIFYLLSLLFWIISLVTALFFEGRMIHDIIAGSWVVKREI